LLQVPEGAPVLMQELLVRDRDGVPRELSYTHYRGGRVSLAVQAPAESA
jgi:GntR family transcriptional regulator